MMIIEGHNRRISRPWVIYGILLINVILLLELKKDAHGILNLLAYSLEDPKFLTALTSLFVHAGWLHFLGNALYLYSFGDNVEDVLGPILFPVVFLTAGIASVFSFQIFHTGDTSNLVGSSGAISGILGVYWRLFPKVKSWVHFETRYFRIIEELPVRFSLLFWFLFQVIVALLAELPGLTPVAFSAHIGGFLTGAAIGMALQRTSLPDRHRERLLRLKKSNRHVLCPSCNHDTHAPGYGKHTCETCNQRFIFSRTGIQEI